ncbi:Ribosome biogenesis protein BOP1 -like protein [Caligus rogercresseyi]|uniref:Ribosome biogenesis protein BOP1 -like protein n=1 Tax=Caligus rogercresseyi TaxID=217165 RepID=A0A7T8KD00_CALRO|nr:Ribosome biogenesis protein BOP1 -like protein [Caligus rogercresseyi]
MCCSRAQGGLRTLQPRKAPRGTNGAFHKMGWMKTKAQKEKEAKEAKIREKNRYYMLWKSDDVPEGKGRDIIPAPKMKLPGHAESYNPPPEYLFTENEKVQWKTQEEEPYKRKHNFIPQKYKSLREVPAYKKLCYGAIRALHGSPPCSSGEKNAPYHSA